MMSLQTSAILVLFQTQLMQNVHKICLCRANSHIGCASLELKLFFEPSSHRTSAEPQGELSANRPPRAKVVFFRLQTWSNSLDLTWDTVKSPV